jgi:ribosomal protein L11 methyltransferase
VGAGSGILAIACALLGASHVLALELDPWASAAARENVEANGVTDRVEVETRGVGPAFLAGVDPFDGIVANMESPILRPLLGGFHGGLRPGGWIILSGILAAEAEEMSARMEALGFQSTGAGEEEGWVALAFRKPIAGDGLPEVGEGQAPPVPA